MKKEDNTKLTVDEILEEIENSGMDVPKVQCSICGREKPAHAVYTLPEVWRHGRRLALYMLGKAPRPEPVDEEGDDPQIWVHSPGCILCELLVGPHPGCARKRRVNK